ncbi:hypothetical protein L3Q82_002569 [Scortum barcoo]|uniref:Uncharacterized protein n=1 Tax=Scortum barcoo TaxID=214431 RepID=A0ACB8VTP7_9TELE|nr:hypothetical protein L3Q82_002569 [Scortum barcoo]
MILQGQFPYFQIKEAYSDGLGEKLFLNLVVLHRMLQNLLPEGRSEKSPWWGCEASLMMFSGLGHTALRGNVLHRRKELPMIFSAVLTTLLTFLQSAAVHPPHHTEMQLVKDALYSTPVEHSEDGRGQVGSLHPSQEVQALLCPLNQRRRVHRPCEVICDVHPQELAAADHLHG